MQITPPPIPNAASSQQDLIDPLFLKPEKAIIAEFINRELSKSGVDIKADSLWHIEKKKIVATSIAAAIILILIIVFQVFHYSVISLAVIIFPVVFIILRKFTSATMADFFEKEVKSRPNENFSDIIAPHLYEKCKNYRMMRWLILLMCVVVIPVLIFLKPHIFYEDGPGGKYVRFYTEGLFGNNDVVVPDYVDEQPVVGIRGDVFCNTDIYSVTLPESIDTIRGHAFESCRNLHKITMSKKLKYIGASAFSDCVNLESITLPESTTYIGSNAFYNCMDAKFTLGSNIDFIGSASFYRCCNLQKITLGNNIDKIHENAFAASGLKKIVIPDSVQTISGSAFSNCAALEEVTFGSESKLVRIGGHAFENCVSLKEVHLPSLLREIGSSAFRNCENLTTVEIPQGCTVNEKAFKNSSNVEIKQY